MSYEFLEYPDREMLVMDLASKLAGDLRAALRQTDRVAFAVPGGTTPGPVFDDLCAADLDWSRVDVLLTDERWVPEDDPRSNTRLLRERLLVDRAAAARFLPICQGNAAPGTGLDALAQRIAPELPLAVVLLGMGADWHTASLFPGSEQLADALSPQAPLLVPVTAPGAPEPRVTLAAHVLNGAMRKHVLILGKEKRAALEAAKGKPLSRAPVNAVLPEARVHWAE